MSATIDERVVQMRFDNSGFQKNVESSIQSLNNLNKAISGMNTSSLDGLKNASASINKMDFSGLSNSIDAVTNKFSAWGIAGITAIQNVANKAFEAGEKIVKSLTIDPVTTGFNEYELKMGSVQTIMNGANVDLQTTMNTLEELNKYADRTIYSFSDMTQNIGKFVNAGVDLDTAVNAIKGISNEAALAGAGATEASRAMYNIAQAIGTGSMKLIDWKSIENANMATMQFKQTLIETGKELGTINEETSKIDLDQLTAENFRESISGVEGQTWITNDVMMKALAKYSDETTEIGKKAYAAAQDVKTFSMLMDTLKEAAQSGWAESMENIFGDFEQAKALWTDVNNEISGILDRSAKERNDILDGWNKGGGRDAVISGISNVWKALFNDVKNGKAVINDIKKAFKDIFPTVTSKQLIDISKRFSELTNNFKAFMQSTKTSKTIVGVFTGIFAGIKKIKDGFSNLLLTVKPVFKVFKEAWKEIFPKDTSDSLLLFSSYILRIGIAFNNATIKLKEFITNEKNLSNIKETFKGILSIVDLLRKGIVNAANVIKSVLSPLIGSGSAIGSSLLSISASIGKFFTDINNGISIADAAKGFGDRLSESFQKIARTFTIVKKMFTNSGSSLMNKKSLQSIGISNSIIEFIQNFVDKIKSAFDKLKDTLSFKGSGTSFNLKEKLSGITDSELFDKLGNNFEKNKNLIGKGIDWLREKYAALQMDMPDMEPFFDVMKKLGSGILNVVVSGLNLIASAFNGLSMAFEKSPLLTLQTIIKSITNIGLYSEFKNLIGIFSKKIKDDNLGKALVSLLNSIKGGNFNAKIIMEIAISIGILAASLVALSIVDTEKLGWALGALTAVIVELVGAFTALNKLNTGGESGFAGLIKMFTGLKISTVNTALLKFSIAVAILGASLATLIGSGASGEQMLTAVSGLSILLWELVAVSKVLGTGNSKSFLGAASSVIMFSTAITQLIRPLIKLCQFSWDQMLIGVGGLSAIIWELIAVTKFSKNIKMGDVSGLSTIAVCVSILGMSLKSLGELSLTQLGVGLLGLTVALGELVIVAKMLGDAESTKEGAAGMVAMSVAIAILAHALNSLGNLSADQLTQGFMALVAMMAGLLIYLKLLPDTMMSTAIATLVMGAALDMLVLGIKGLASLEMTDLLTGLAGLAGGMLILVGAMKLMQSNIGGAAAMLIVSVGLIALAKSFQMFAELDPMQIVTGLLAIAGSLTIMAVAMMAMQAGIAGAAAMLVMSIGLIALAGAFRMLEGVSIETIGIALLGLAGTIAVFAIAAALLTPLLLPMAGLAAVLLLLAASVAVVGAGIMMMAQGLALLGTNGGLGLEIMTDFCELIVANIPKFVESSAALWALDSALLLFATATGLAGIGCAAFGAGLIVLSLGLVAVSGAAIVCEKAFAKIAKDLEDLPENARKAGGNFIKGLTKGLTSGIKNVVKAAKNVGNKILTSIKKVLKIHSPSKEGEEIGKNTDAGIDKGLQNGSEKLEKTSEGIGASIKERLKSGLGELIGGKLELDPELSLNTDTSSILDQYKDLGSNQTITLDNDSDTEELLKKLQSGNIDSFDTSSIISDQDKLTDSINAQTDAIENQTEATKEQINILLTRDQAMESYASNVDREQEDSILGTDYYNVYKHINSNLGIEYSKIKDAVFGSNGELDKFIDKLSEVSGLSKEDTISKLGDDYNNLEKQIKKTLSTYSFSASKMSNAIENLDENKFSKFFTNIGINYDEWKNKFGFKDYEIADIFQKSLDDVEKNGRKFSDVFGEIFGESISCSWKTFSDEFNKIEEEYDKLGDNLTRDERLDWWFNQLGFESANKIDSVFESLSKSASEAADAVTDTTKKAVISADELEKKAKDVIAGKYGNGADRVKALGDEWAVVQNKVNEMLGSSVRHDTNITVGVDSTEVDEASEKVEELTTKTKSYQQQVLENQDKLPTAVKEAVESQMSYQDRLLQNESKLPTEVANKLKAINEESKKTADNVVATGEEATKAVDKYSSYIESVNENASSVPTSVINAINKTAEETPAKFTLSEVDTTAAEKNTKEAITQISENSVVDVDADTTKAEEAFEVMNKKLGDYKDNTSNVLKVIYSFYDIMFKNIEQRSLKTYNLLNGYLNRSKDNTNNVLVSIDEMFDEFFTNLEEKARTTFETILDEFLNTFSEINVDGMDTNIRPVIDNSPLSSNVTSLLNSSNSSRLSSNVSTQFSNKQQDTTNRDMVNKLNQLNSQVSELSDAMKNQQTNVDVNVELQGDARGLFNAVQKESKIYNRTTGRVAFN